MNALVIGVVLLLFILCLCSCYSIQEYYNPEIMETNTENVQAMRDHKIWGLQEANRDDNGVMDIQVAPFTANMLSNYSQAVENGVVDTFSSQDVVIPKEVADMSGRMWDIKVPESFMDGYGSISCQDAGHQWVCKIMSAESYSAPNEDPSWNQMRNSEIHNEEHMLLRKLMRELDYIRTSY
jgi:hypothetical protein